MREVRGDRAIRSVEADAHLDAADEHLPTALFVG
jgi:hypothetical protein